MEEASKRLASRQGKIDAATKKKAAERRAANRKRQEAERAAKEMQKQIEAIRQADAPYCQTCNDEIPGGCVMCNQH